MSRIKAWARADREYRDAGERALVAMQKALPVGSEVRWRQGENRVYGDVIWVSEWGYKHARVGVRSHRSGKEYSIYADRILSCMAATPESGND